MVALAATRRDDSAHRNNEKINEYLAEEAKQKLIVALDFDTIEEAEELVRELGDEVAFYKVGLGLQLAGGDRFARELKSMKKRVFLDYKYYDIDKTIENAVRRAAELEIDFLTVHGVSGILRSAVKGRGNSSLKLFCVTVLTSMDAKDLEEMGYPPSTSVEDLVVHRAKLALEAGLDGVIAAGIEAAKIKSVTKNRLLVVSPGIRPDGSPVDDQKRTMTPADAINEGADYLVIGRPITESANPKASALEILAQMAGALRAAG